MAAETVENCIDIVRPFRDELDKAGLLEGVQFIGGVGSAALVHEASLILPDEAMVVAPADLYLPSKRDDGNKRDMDILVLSTDEGRVKEIEGMAKDAVDRKLHVSVFGLRQAGYVKKQLRHPVFGWKAFKTFVSDRYVGEDGSMDKVVFPFGVPMDPESMQSYHLQVGDLVVPIASPPAALMNYSTRSISGLRPKDERKVQQMATNIFAKVPDYTDWIETGPGASQVKLAQALHSLRGPSSFEKAQALILGGAVKIDPVPIRALMRHETFLLRDRNAGTQQKALAWARIKSAGLGKAESYDEVVRLYQKWAERLFGSISKNK